MMATFSYRSGPVHTVLCVLAGMVLAMLLAADLPRDTVPPGLDSAAQRLRMQDELAALNGKMDDLIQLLRSGNVKVICLPADTDGRGLNHDGRTQDSKSAPSHGTPPPRSYAR